MPGYYSEKLSAERLEKVYQLATPRVKQYLAAEIKFVLDRIKPGESVLELGCGYGRVMASLAAKAGHVCGVDTSMASLRLAMNRQVRGGDFSLAQMDAGRLAFADGAFDVVVCIQNGISAFKVNRSELISESVRVTRRGGKALFSSYSEKFWSARLQWFEMQAGAGLLGEIDYEATGAGVIVCKDGFEAGTVGRVEFAELTAKAAVEAVIEEVDSSSLFCVVLV